MSGRNFGDCIYLPHKNLLVETSLASEEGNIITRLDQHKLREKAKSQGKVLLTYREVCDAVNYVTNNLKERVSRDFLDSEYDMNYWTHVDTTLIYIEKMKDGSRVLLKERNEMIDEISVATPGYIIDDYRGLSGLPEPSGTIRQFDNFIKEIYKINREDIEDKEVFLRENGIEFWYGFIIEPKNDEERHIVRNWHWRPAGGGDCLITNALFWPSYWNAEGAARFGRFVSLD